MNADKRRYLRMGAFLEGTFQTEDSKKGLIMLTNFSREGVKASINRNIAAGAVLKIEIWIPGSIVPIFASGVIVWIRPASEEWTYKYDAGLRIIEIEPDDRQRVLDFAYAHWRNARGKL